MGHQKIKYDAMLPIALDGGAIGVAALSDDDRILELRESLIHGLMREGWNSADAEDWAHDILELAIRYRDQLRNPASFLGWLKAIKINLLRNRYKRRKKELDNNMCAFSVLRSLSFGFRLNEFYNRKEKDIARLCLMRNM